MEDSSEAGIKLEERFGRAKRNSITFSSILLLLSFVESQGKVAVAPLGSDSQINYALTLTFLMISATYFFIGYARARRLIDRLNSRLSILQGEGAFSSVFENFKMHVDHYKTQVQKAESFRVFVQSIINDTNLAEYNRKVHEINQVELPRYETYRDNAQPGIHPEAIPINYGLALKKHVDENNNLSRERFYYIMQKLNEIPEHDISMEVKSEDQINLLITQVKLLTEKTLEISENIETNDRLWLEWYDHYPTLGLFFTAMVCAAWQVFLHTEWLRSDNLFNVIRLPYC